MATNRCSTAIRASAVLLTVALALTACGSGSEQTRRRAFDTRTEAGEASGPAPDPGFEDPEFEDSEFEDPEFEDPEFEDPEREPVPTEEPTRGLDLAGIAGVDSVWLTSREVGDINGNRIVRSVYLAFDDGSATRDLAGVLAGGAAASRAAEPNMWGRWRLGGSGFEYFPSTGTAFFGFQFAGRSESLNGSTGLNGCFASRGDFSLGPQNVPTGGTVISTNEFCFDPNGQFSNDRAVAIDTPGSLSTSVGDRAGTFSTNGNVVTLQYANGQQVQAVLGLTRFASGTTWISINNTVLA